ncbi:hypothetical protein [Humibacillus sp. DSM 29435]|nr:hypothetical protein [Humibacillus sp. DSM 29435]
MSDQPGETEKGPGQRRRREVLSLSWLADEAAALDAALSDAAK